MGERDEEVIAGKDETVAAVGRGRMMVMIEGTLETSMETEKTDTGRIEADLAAKMAAGAAGVEVKLEIATAQTTETRLSTVLQMKIQL